MDLTPIELDGDAVGFRSWELRSDGELRLHRRFDAGPPVSGQEISALHSLDAEELREEFALPWRVVGAIRPTSAMLSSAASFICSHAEVVALARSPHWGRDEQEAAARAAQRYRAPLVEFQGLATVASEHGSPVPALRPPREPPSPSEKSASEPTDKHEGAPPAVIEPLPTFGDLPEPRSGPAQRHTGVAAARFGPRGSARWTWLDYCAIGAALSAFGVGLWLLARSDWLVLSFLLLALAAAAIAAGSGDRLEVAVRSAGAGFLGALLHIVAADVSDNSATPDLFGVLVIVWLMVATSFACAVAAVVSRAPASASGKLTALTSIALPLASAFAAGLLALPAAFCAAVVAMVQLLCLVLWRRILQRELGPASGAR